MGLFEQPVLRVAEDHGVPCDCASVGQFVEQLAGFINLAAAGEVLDLGVVDGEIREGIWGFQKGRSGKKLVEEVEIEFVAFLPPCE